MGEIGHTALHLAAKQDAYLTQDILQPGIDNNIRNVNGELQPTCAVNAEEIDIVIYKIRIHADVNVDNNNQAIYLRLTPRKDQAGSISQLLSDVTQGKRNLPRQ